MAGTKTRFSLAKPNTLKCTYCGKFLKNFSAYVGCASPECLAAEVKHCVDCFSVGAHLLPHKPNHPYTVVRFDEEDPEIYETGWTVREEIALLNSVTNHGIYKWRSVARAVPRKTPRMCEVHFYLLHRMLEKPDKEEDDNELASSTFQEEKAEKKHFCEKTNSKLSREAPKLEDPKSTKSECPVSNGSLPEVMK